MQLQTISKLSDERLYNQNTTSKALKICWEEAPETQTTAYTYILPQEKW